MNGRHAYGKPHLRMEALGRLQQPNVLPLQLSPRRQVQLNVLPQGARDRALPKVMQPRGPPHHSAQAGEWYKRPRLEAKVRWVVRATMAREAVHRQAP